MKKIAKALILLALLSACEKDKSYLTPPPRQCETPRVGPFDWSREYRMKVIDEHVVRFVCGKDTLYISIENAMPLASQNYIAFVILPKP